MKVKDMTKGNELKLIILFSLPLMLGNIFQQLYTVCDTIIVSRHLGVKALAAIGCCDWLTWMGIAVVTGLAQGFQLLYLMHLVHMIRVMFKSVFLL